MFDECSIYNYIPLSDPCPAGQVHSRLVEGGAAGRHRGLRARQLCEGGSREYGRQGGGGGCTVGYRLMECPE